MQFLHHRGSKTTKLPTASRGCKLNTVYVSSYYWQRSVMLPTQAFQHYHAMLRLENFRRMKGTDIFLGCKKSLWQQRCQCRKGRGLCTYEFEQGMSLVMDKYSLHVLLPGGSGQSASSGFPGSLNDKGGTSYQLQISWVSSGLQITDWLGTEVWKAKASWWKVRTNHSNAQIINKEKQTQVMTGWKDVT